MAYLWGEILCALLVGGGIGITGFYILEWQREREAMQEEINALRQEVRKRDPLWGYPLTDRR